ncbi:MAG: glutathione peroxidase [Leptospira sp.]|nr:glutathione peroxidase [Leptospira sp.]
MSNSIYDFTVNNNKGEEVSLADYKGKALLIVNTASKCGFTPQYEGLQQVYDKYKDQGFEVLAFPCNQFGSQEPGTDSDIQSFCNLNYSTKFPLFKKIDVNGENAHPLFNFLKEQAPGLMGLKDIKWNFTKFLVDKNGKVLKRYASITKPESIQKDIEDVLSN